MGLPVSHATVELFSLFPPSLQSWFNQLLVFLSCFPLSPFLRGQWNLYNI